jgi:hypothetical protein
LASKDAMPFDLLKQKLFSRLNTMGIRISKTYEEVRVLAMLVSLTVNCSLAVLYFEKQCFH